MTPLPDSAELGLDEDAQHVDSLARDVLGENYFHFVIEKFVVEERETGVHLAVNLERAGAGGEFVLKGEGVGMVDAFFDGVIKAWGEEYPSLKTIAVSDFQLESVFDDDTKGRRSDAKAKATLLIENSEEVKFTFVRQSKSITWASIRAALDALTFFINSERAFVQLTLAVKDAKERRRSDLVTRYRQQMGLLVRATSYSEVIERHNTD
ncbi:MAG: hypothetical protein GY822_27170 [Deltaproteobacteria bacterium]|nr:hypothetical protein [Deltaproteobacteria bacterium]